MEARRGTLGLIAGGGRFPLEAARAARARGDRLVVVGFRGETDPAVEDLADVFEYLHLGQLGRLIDLLHEADVSRVVMVGKVWKSQLFTDPASLHLDDRALALLKSLRDRRDDSILGAIAGALEAEGICIESQPAAVPELFAGPGPVGALDLTPSQRDDAAFGWRIAKVIAGLDIGQTVVVKDRAVMAVEAIEGTDAAIGRGGALAGGGAVVVKVAKPQQDPRFDMPTIGPETAACLGEARAAALVFEAPGTAVLARELLAREADARELAVVGLHADSVAGSAA